MPLYLGFSWVNINLYIYPRWVGVGVVSEACTRRVRPAG